MVSLILIGIYCVALCTIYGIFTIILTGKLTGLDFSKPSFTLAWLTGFCVVSGLTSILSLFIRIGLAANSILLAGATGIAIWLWRRGYLKWERYLNPLHPLTMMLGVICFLVVLEIGTQSPSNPDTGLYHAQAIRWIENFPAVPGLGNLHTRFAYNSSWLVLNALFSFSFINLRSFHVLPGVFYLVFLLDQVSGVNRILRGNTRLSNFLQLLLLPVAIYTQGNAFASPGTDFPATLLIWILILEWMRWKEEDSRDSFRPFLIILLVAFVLTIKLSALPIAIFAVVLGAIQIVKKQWKRLFVMGMLGLIILLPWFARNVIISGYLVYPEPSIDIFSFDWKIPPEVAAAEKETIQSWAKIPRWEVATVQSMPLREWATIWYYNQTTNRKLMLLAIPILLGVQLAFAVFFPTLCKQALKGVYPYRLNYLTVLIGLIFWFQNAPSFRFGIGWVTAALLLLLMPWVQLVITSFSRHALLWKGSTVVILVYLVVMLAQSTQPDTFTQRLLLQADYKQLPTQPCEFNGFNVMCADSYQQCWYDPFPCVPGGNPNVSMRGTSYHQGFKWIK